MQNKTPDFHDTGEPDHATAEADTVEPGHETAEADTGEPDHETAEADTVEHTLVVGSLGSHSLLGLLAL